MAYDTSTVVVPVEAFSLTNVTSIATAPPLDPNLPTKTPNLPLVLYIARVPGSRDVFLTTAKPRDKVVSAEDVESSLYYVHVNCAEDAQLSTSSVNADIPELVSRPPLPARPTNGGTSGQDRAGFGKETSMKWRPPLPKRPNPTPPYPVDDGMIPDLPNRFSNLQTVLRKPAPRNAPSDLPPLPRRPLPSLPIERTPTASSIHAENVRLLRHSDHTEERNPYYQEYAPPDPTPPALDAIEQSEPGSLTLIRRDPMSSEQWNVADIHDPPIQEVSSNTLLSPGAASRTKKGGAPLYLDITNPAYAQFTGVKRSESRVSTSTSGSSESDPPPEGVFRRRLYMPGSRFAEHGYANGRNSTGSGSDISIRKTMRHSVDMGSVSTSPAMTDRRNKSYTFDSPWDGRCEFVTGTTGKALKCKHYLPSFRGGAVNEVSELRFNLPTNSRKGPTSLADKRSTYFSGMHMRSQFEDSFDQDRLPTFMIGEDGKMDLSLGQERAGGGFGGKQAKLGKLIIEPEGLKMLDLLVAANIGLWWRAYERS